MLEKQLPGFSNNNFLAFLALIGLLKILDHKKEWKIKTAWVDTHPRLYLDTTNKKNIEDEIVDEVLVGLEKYSKNIKFSQYYKEITEDMKNSKKNQNPSNIELVKNIKDFSMEDFLKFQKSHPDVGTALGSIQYNNQKNNQAFIDPTPLCMMFGAGRQNFLSRLEESIKIEDKISVSEDIKNTLFSVWKYEEAKKPKEKISFRWDPKEYRPHAYRDKDPSQDSLTFVKGANRLAAVGFTAYYCVPTTNKSETISYKDNKIYWPIWKMKLSLQSILFIMRYPYINDIKRYYADPKYNEFKDLKDRMRSYGIERIMEAELFWDGKFKNTTIAKRIM